MKTLLFSAKKHDRAYFDAANKSFQLAIDYQSAPLGIETVALCEGYQAVCVFVNDCLNAKTIEQVSGLGVEHIILRCAGYNNVDLAAAERFGLTVSRVPAYSPEAVAEHTVALMMMLSRKLHKAYNRVRENNFSLDGLVGFNFHGKTVGIVGTGKIGRCVAQILLGIGCHIKAYDPVQDNELKKLDGLDYVALQDLLSHSHIISLHCPLNEASHHMINQKAIDSMQDNVMLINTSRGAVVDTRAVINGLKSKKIGYLGMDVYEMESELFFEDKSLEVMQDDVFSRLVSFPNVVITGHQGFYTHEALEQIAATTLANISLCAQNKTSAETFVLGTTAAR